MVTAADVREFLRLPAADAAWIDTWDCLAAGPAPVPSAAEIERLMVDRLGVDPIDAAAAAAARPDRRAEPELWWVIDRCHAQLESDMGGFGMLLWPRIPERLGAAGRFLYLYPLLAAIPATLEFYRRRGLDEDLCWATLGNFSEKLRLNRARYDLPGLSVAFWFTLHVRGALFQLGRLEFAIERLGDGHPFAGHDAGELTVGVHIPGDGPPLTVDACRASIERARGFFPKYFGDRFAAPPTLTCSSWMLDPQLCEVLPAGSRIAAFQDLFELMPAAPDADARGQGDVLLFVFDHVGPFDAAALPRDTSLRRELADGFAAGRRWQVRSGIARLH